MPVPLDFEQKRAEASASRERADPEAALIVLSDLRDGDRNYIETRRTWRPGAVAITQRASSRIGVESGNLFIR